MSPRFSLAGLLRLRTVQEQQAKAELLVVRERVRRNERLQNRLREALAGGKESTASIESLIAIAAARSSTARMLGELQALGARLDEEVESHVLAQARARRNALALERLEERHAAGVAAEALREEQLVIDEAAARGFRLLPGAEAR